MAARSPQRKDDGTAPQKPVVLTGTDLWAACSEAEYGHVGHHRHIIARGALTTVCGTTASHPEIWRGNSKKPRCPRCVIFYGKRENR